LFSLITCIISIQPFLGHIHHAKLVINNAANMQKELMIQLHMMLTSYFNV